MGDIGKHIRYDCHSQLIPWSYEVRDHEEECSGSWPSNLISTHILQLSSSPSDIYSPFESVSLQSVDRAKPFWGDEGDTKQ